MFAHSPAVLVKEEWSAPHRVFKGKERCLLDAPHLCVELRKGSKDVFLGESVLRKAANLQIELSHNTF